MAKPSKNTAMSQTPIVVMGVSGCGKSSVGAALADAIGGVYLDGDDFHPEANVTKMAEGLALTDADRAPWLAQVAKTLHEAPPPIVIGCSALRRRYRDVLRDGRTVHFVYLQGAPEVIRQRMSERQGHYMPLSLLESQFAALEPPEPDENAIAVDIDQTIDQIVATVLQGFDT